jgi:Putative rhamnosyl transferase
MLGLCRFSVLVEGGFQVVHPDLQARRAMLYDPQRLASRFVWFEHLCLASLRAQSDADFTLVVLVGEDFPDVWRKRLDNLVAGMPQVVVTTQPPGRHRDVCIAAMASFIDPQADVVGQFRLDDDDAVAVDYIARSRADFALVEGLYQRHGLVASNYARGLQVTDTGDALIYEKRAATDWSCGLTLYFPPDSATGVMDYGHHRLAEFMPTISQNDSLMYLRGRHQSNDTRPKGQGKYEVWDTARVTPVLSSRFGIDGDAFETALRAAGKK